MLKLMQEEKAYLLTYWEGKERSIERSLRHDSWDYAGWSSREACLEELRQVRLRMERIKKEVTYYDSKEG